MTESTSCTSWGCDKMDYQNNIGMLTCYQVSKSVSVSSVFRVLWTARRSNQSSLKKSTLNIHWKDWCWSWNPNTLVTWCEELTHWKRPWSWKRLKAGGKGNDRWWDGWAVSPTRWTWVWASSWSWRWTGKPGMLQSMGSQRVTQLNDWTELKFSLRLNKILSH